MSRAAAWLPRLLFAGLGALGLGMMLVVGGVLVGPLFIPGAALLAGGFLLLSVAGVLASIGGDGDAAEPARASHAEARGSRSG
jgi:hypothetical protein